MGNLLTRELKRDFVHLSEHSDFKTALRAAGELLDTYAQAEKLRVERKQQRMREREIKYHRGQVTHRDRDGEDIDPMMRGDFHDEDVDDINYDEHGHHGRRPSRRRHHIGYRMESLQMDIIQMLTGYFLEEAEIHALCKLEGLSMAPMQAHMKTSVIFLRREKTILGNHCSPDAGSKLQQTYTKRRDEHRDHTDLMHSGAEIGGAIQESLTWKGHSRVSTAGAVRVAAEADMVVLSMIQGQKPEAQRTSVDLDSDIEKLEALPEFVYTL
ncbi:peptidyl-prolyl cis-trans isomerase ssp-1 [Physcia stellaris]|nr:peptidyl-prolyl cis-trans isomerase ssp-1 [Physcia stellaris]